MMTVGGGDVCAVALTVRGDWHRLVATGDGGEPVVTVVVGGWW